MKEARLGDFRFGEIRNGEQRKGGFMMIQHETSRREETGEGRQCIANDRK